MEQGESPKKKRRIRACKRKAVTANTMRSLSEDTWLMVCAHFFFSPHCVFRLMKASKCIWLALKDNKLWWDAFFVRIQVYQSMITCSIFALKLRAYAKRPNKMVALQLIFGKECTGCGTRYWHSIFDPIGARLCQWCVHDRLVSNKVLLQRYGIHFADMLVEYHAKGGVFITHKQFKQARDTFLQLTSDAIDLRHTFSGQVAP